MAELLAFSLEDAARLSGLSPHRIARLDRVGLLRPSYATDDRRLPYSRIYSFRDVVGLRTIARLRDEHGVSLRELRRIQPWLEQHHETPWASLRLYVGGRKVFFDNPETGERMAGRPAGQVAFPFEMQRVADELTSAMRPLRERQPADIGQVKRNRFVVSNAWVVAGTRIPTSTIWEFHRAGYDVDDIIREYPRLTRADVEAALRHEEALRQAREKGVG